MRNGRMILLVEDNELNREILTTILEDSYNVIQAENGQIGLEKLKKYGDKIMLILLDIHMPVLDGYGFLEAVSGMSAAYRSIPIVVTTANNADSDEIKSLEMGATDFITKPYNPYVVLKRVDSMIRLRESSALLHRMERDSLTGVYSKEFFFEYAARTIADSPDKHFDMVCWDIETFRIINERYGMAGGNEALAYIGSILNEMNGGDIVPGRVGTDVFMVLMPHLDIEEHRVKIAHFLEEMKSCPVTGVNMKAGIYLDVDRNSPVTVMCDNARLAANRVKYHYGSSYAEYDKTIRDKQKLQHQITDAMEKSLADRDYKVYFQPKYSMRNKRTEGAEALVRWIHPEIGFISPGAFIPIFESNGFVAKVDAYILEEVCRCQHEWLNTGKPVVPVSVNVSRADFANPNLVDDYTAIVDRYKIPHRLIHFEVTESMYSSDPKRILSDVHNFRQRGFAVELDDFGSGYSSMHVLSEMEIDTLKLDMSLMREIFEYKHRCVLENILSIASNLGMNVVAEGVETLEQVEALNEMALKQSVNIYAQGYYYCKPIPQEQFEEYLSKETNI